MEAIDTVRCLDDRIRNGASMSDPGGGSSGAGAGVVTSGGGRVFALEDIGIEFEAPLIEDRDSERGSPPPRSGALTELA